MPITYVDTKNGRLYTAIDGYSYSIPLDNDWATTIAELLDGGYRATKPGVYILGTAQAFEHIVTIMKRGE